MDKALDSGVAGQPGEPGRADMVDQLEGLPSGFLQNPDAIDQPLVAGKKGRQQLGVVQGDVQEGDLTDLAHRLQEFGGLGIAAADCDPVAAFGEPADNVAADKAGPAEHGDPLILHPVPATFAPPPRRNARSPVTPSIAPPADCRKPAHRDRTASLPPGTATG